MQKLANAAAAFFWLLATGISLILCIVLYPLIWIFDAARKIETQWIDPYDKGYDRADLSTTAGRVELILVLILAAIFIGTLLFFQGYEQENKTRLNFIRTHGSTWFAHARSPCTFALLPALALWKTKINRPPPLAILLGINLKEDSQNANTSRQWQCKGYQQMPL